MRKGSPVLETVIQRMSMKTLVSGSAAKQHVSVQVKKKKKTHPSTSITMSGSEPCCRVLTNNVILLIDISDQNMCRNTVFTSWA